MGYVNPSMTRYPPRLYSSLVPYGPPANVAVGKILYTLLKWVVTVAQRCVSIGTIANLLSSILTILLTCPNSDTLLCCSNDPLLTV